MQDNCNAYTVALIPDLYNGYTGASILDNIQGIDKAKVPSPL
jgi:hypothetical protein